MPGQKSLICRNCLGISGEEIDNEIIGRIQSVAAKLDSCLKRCGSKNSRVVPEIAACLEGLKRGSRAGCLLEVVW